MAAPRAQHGRSIAPKAPVRVSGGRESAVRRIRVITPCYNAPADLRILYEDLRRLEREVPAAGGRLELAVLVIDNASSEPLEAIEPPAGLDVRVVRLEENTGGSGGYNAGMALALREAARENRPPEFLWLLDSDARPAPAALAELVRAMDEHPEMACIGSAIAEPGADEPFEVGGRIERVLGQYCPCYGEERPPPREVVEVEYAAACSALVRTEAARRGGLFPQVFLNGDDIEWCFRLREASGGKIGATTRSLVRHPRLKPGLTLPRYFIARNAFGPVDALGLGWRVRLLRALRELPRALAQIMIGRDDLADLHVRGLEDAAAGRLAGRGAMGELRFEPFAPYERAVGELAGLAAERKIDEVWLHPMVRLEEEHAQELEAAFAAAGLRCPAIPRGSWPYEAEPFAAGLGRAIGRVLRGPRRRIAVIPARGRPNAWCRGRLQLEVIPGGAVVREVRRGRMARAAVRMLGRSLVASLRIARRSPGERCGPGRIPTVEDVAASLPASAERG